MRQFGHDIGASGDAGDRLAAQRLPVGASRSAGGRRRGPRARWRVMPFVAMAAAAALSGCGSDVKSYDISPIFPVSSDKCATYRGTVQGSGLTAHCWVTKAECERAASDWEQAMQQGGVKDAVLFSCD
jgi:hypothetical protein